MSNPEYPKRQRRLARIFDQFPSYFLTMCTESRKPVLADSDVLQRAESFCADSLERYGIYIHCFVLMPDHIHLIITVSMDSETTIGEWVKAFKFVVGRREFKWQRGFFDHVLRSDESRSEKWEYIRMNPVRAGLVDNPDAWPYAKQFNPFDGSEM